MLLVAASPQGLGQDEERQRRRERPERPPTLGLDQGFLDFETPDFHLRLVRASQTAAALEPQGADGFDFTPADRLERRTSDGFYHLGDLTARVRTSDTEPWMDVSTAAARKPVTPLETSKPTLAAADLTPSLPPNCPLRITREWALDEGKLVLRFTLENTTDGPVQIGSLGIPVVFNNIITRRSLEEAHRVCSFFDPYIGLDAGYLQVTRLSGAGPALVVVPWSKTPFEGYRLLREPMRPNQTFEGTFEWLVHTKAYAENEWRDAEPWNPPSAKTLAPGERVRYGLKFLVADEIRQIEATLAAAGRPVAVGLPSYILPRDLDGRLFVRYASNVASLDVEPAGALEIRDDGPTDGPWQAYTVRGRKWGRARLTITYDDQTRQSIHYYVIKPAREAVADLGHFLMTKQWFDDPDDPFGRSPSVMSYDRQRDEIVRQDGRVWIAGLSDEGGACSWLAAAMKQFGQPDREELQKYQRFVDEVLWGGIQYAEGERKYGVRKSMFYYAPEEMPPGYYRDDISWGSWTSWDKAHARRVDRSFNYPHVAAAYWSLYRLARNHDGLVTNHPWHWYLERAYETAQAMMRYAPGYGRHGQMEGDIFLATLLDLQREGWTDKAAALEATMRRRADRWAKEAYPFGSEMAWDSTGQEEVYAWCKYFGFEDKAQVSLNSILGYMPTLPHWGYNGCARRYWDFLYAGKLSRIERQLHHYGSGINSIPVLAEYREHPEDFYLLRVGYGGSMGALSNIDQEGFASAAFHSFPSTLEWDAYSGDYGSNFFGHAFTTATYIVRHPEFGWLALGGNVAEDGRTVRVKPLDSFRMRLYAAPLGLWLTLDAGQFEACELDPEAGTLRIGLASASPSTSKARLRVEQPADIPDVGTLAPTDDFPLERGAYVVPLETKTTWVTIAPTK